QDLPDQLPALLASVQACLPIAVSCCSPLWKSGVLGGQSLVGPPLPVVASFELSPESGAPPPVSEARARLSYERLPQKPYPLHGQRGAGHLLRIPALWAWLPLQPAVVRSIKAGY